MGEGELAVGGGSSWGSLEVVCTWAQTAPLDPDGALALDK